MPGNSRVMSKKNKLDSLSESSPEPEPRRRGRPKKSQTNNSVKDKVNTKENLKNSKKSLAKEPQRTLKRKSQEIDDVEDDDNVFKSDEESDVVLTRRRKKSSTITNSSKLSSKPSTNKNVSSATVIISSKDNQAPKSADNTKNSVLGTAETTSKQTERFNTTSSSTILQRKHGSQSNNSTITRPKNSAIKSGSGFIRVSSDEWKNKEAEKAKKEENVVKPVDWTLLSSSGGSGSESETSPKVIDSQKKTLVSEKEDKTGDNNNSETSNLNNNNNNNDNHESSPSPLPLVPESNNNTPLITPTTSMEAFVIAFVDEKLEEYKSLANTEEDYLKVPAYSNPVRFSFPQDQHWESISPGVLMSVTFNNSEVKTGYLRIACRTMKPFEKTTKSEITYAVMEGVVAVKHNKFDFNETGVPVLESVEVSNGGHIHIPQNTIYSLENWSTDLEVSLYYCITRV